MADELSAAPFTSLLEQLVAAGLRSATMTPAEVNTPGAWLTLDELVARTVAGGLELRCSLYLVASDQDAVRALGVLGPMLTKVRTVLTPDGPVQATAVVLPHGPTPLPALRVPIHLHT